MATISGTVTSVRLLMGPEHSIGNRYVYHVTADFGEYTASADAGQIASVDTQVQTFTKRAGTFTVRHVAGGEPGIDSTGASVYAVAVTNSSGTLAVDLGSTTVEADREASTGVGVLVIGDWSST